MRQMMAYGTICETMVSPAMPTQREMYCPSISAQSYGRYSTGYGELIAPVPYLWSPGIH
jgi:hypothetical protein